MPTVRAHYRDTILDRAGNALAGARVTVRQVGTVNAIVETIYADDTGGATLVQPLTADASGVISFYLAAPKRADLYVTAPGYTALTVQDIDVTTPVPIAGSTSANQSATLVVAAVDASLETIANADYVCDGTADEVEINAAIAALPAGGGKVVPSEGQFTLAARINFPADNIALEGMGREATIITAVNGSAIDSTMVRISGRSNCSVRHLTIDANKANQAVLLCGLYLENCNNCDVEDVAICDTTHIGLYVDSAASTSPNLIRRVLITGAGKLAVVGGGSAGLQLDNDILGSVVEDLVVIGSSGHGMILGNSDYVKLIRPRSTNNRMRGISATSAHLEIMNPYVAYNGQVGMQILGHHVGGQRVIGGVTERNGYKKDSGTANAAVTITGGGGGVATLTDTREAFTPDFWIGAVVTCNACTFTVTANDNDTLTGAAGWSANPGADGQAWTMAAAFSEGSGLIITTSPHSEVIGLISRYNTIDNGPNENGGIGIEDCDFVKLIGCTAEYNGGPGIFLYIACDCRIIGSTTGNNGQWPAAGQPYGIGLSNDGVNPSSRNIIACCRSYDDQTPKTQTHGYSIRPGAASSDNRVIDSNLSGNDTLNYDDSSGGTGNEVTNTTGYARGTANTGVTAVEATDGRSYTTTLTVSQVDALTTGDAANLADGYLLYTFPAGVVVIDYAYMSLSVHATTEQHADTPDVGLGTVIATGAVATLDGTATFENIITGQTAANASGTATVKTALPTAGVPFIIAAGDAHTLHFNVADGWANDTSGDLTADIAGTVVVVWHFLA